MRANFFSALALSLLFAACRAGGGHEAGREVPSFHTPAVFQDTIPCADCPGIVETIRLEPDSTYLLQRIYMEAENGENRSFTDFGRWSREDSLRLTLYTADRPMRYRLTDRGTLRMLDVNGNEIHSPLNYDLSPASDTTGIREPVRLTGMYRYLADAGRFTECVTGKSFPVAQRGDNARLESAYSKLGKDGNPPMLVSLEGHFAMPPGMEGDTLLRQLVVDRFGQVYPDSTCREFD